MFEWLKNLWNAQYNARLVVDLNASIAGLLAQKQEQAARLRDQQKELDNYRRASMAKMLK